MTCFVLYVREFGLWHLSFVLSRGTVTLLGWMAVVCPVRLTFSRDTESLSAQPFQFTWTICQKYECWLISVGCLVCGLVGWPPTSTINSQPSLVQRLYLSFFQPEWSAVSCTATTSGRAWRCGGFPGGGWCVLWGVYTRLVHSHCLSVPVQLAVSAPAALPLSVRLCMRLHVSAPGLCRLCWNLNLRY